MVTNISRAAQALAAGVCLVRTKLSLSFKLRELRLLREDLIPSLLHDVLSPGPWQGKRYMWGQEQEQVAAAAANGQMIWMAGAVVFA